MRHLRFLFWTRLAPWLVLVRSLWWATRSNFRRPLSSTVQNQISMTRMSRSNWRAFWKSASVQNRPPLKCCFALTIYPTHNTHIIAFSNYRYYDGNLVTFPSPVTNDRAVSFNYVTGGQYERGGSRTNKPEAKALVAELVSRLKSHGFRDSGLTIGVVTFNTEQQRLIEDLLDEARRQDPSIEHHFADAELEPVFVKNLESVQGDERDIMYFSVTYGPGLDGAMPMNFGP